MDGSIPSADRAALAQMVVGYASENDIELERPDEGTFVLVLPGEHKQKTTVLLAVGAHSVSVNAFVIRHPDENHQEFYRWLLERNRRSHAVAFALDQFGDVYLVGDVAIRGLDEAELDRVLGSVLENSDGAFDRLIEMGFASAIRREWQWRTSRGEPTANLEAFRHLVDEDEPDASLRQDGGS